MSIRNTAERYGRVAQTFHWVTAALILFLLPVGLLMTWMPQGDANEVALKVWVYSLHKTLGVTVFAIAVARIVWAIVNPWPVPLHPERKLETFAAETVHWLLYAGILLSPLTGLLHHWTSVGFAPIWWPFGQDLPFLPKEERLSIIFGYLHIGAAIMITVALIGHIGGALKHALFDRDKTITRMICGDDEIITPPLQKPVRHGVPFLAASAVLVSFVGAAYAYGAFVTAPRAEAELAVDAGSAPTEAAWTVDHEASTLGIAVTQLGSPVEGSFANWVADIQLDPDQLDAASVDVQIDTGSLSIGTVSAQATGAEFLDSETFATARFEADDFTLLEDGSYIAGGTLTIRDVTQPFVLPFNLTIDGDTARMQAEATLNRIDFGVGAEAHANEDSVGFEVQVIIDLTATRTSAEPVS